MVIVIFILKNKPSGLYKTDWRGESLNRIIIWEAIKIITISEVMNIKRYYEVRDPQRL